jgi:uncharacterized membrane-anchored protein YitT (DUF2179 family)
VDLALVAAGAFLMAFAIKNMYEPTGLVTGGVSGLAVVASHLWDIPLWLSNTVLNIPLFAAAFKVLGWKNLRWTAVATGLVSVFLYIVPEMDITGGDVFLSALFGGAVCGLGMGLILLCNATTGGTDMAAMLIQRFLRHYSISKILQFLDGAVVLVGAGVFGIHYALYAIIAIFMVSKVSDGLIEGLKFSKAAYIISEKNDQIAQHILVDMQRGVTALPAVGMYSGQDKKMLFCVVSKKEIVKIKEIVAQTDPRAFVIVSDVREVLGEGFITF